MTCAGRRACRRDFLPRGRTARDDSLQFGGCHDGQRDDVDPANRRIDRRGAARRKSYQTADGAIFRGHRTLADIDRKFDRKYAVLL
ncbi:hypothetical protein GCM10009648_22660 [Tsukamurella spumae]